MHSLRLSLLLLLATACDGGAAPGGTAPAAPASQPSAAPAETVAPEVAALRRAAEEVRGRPEQAIEEVEVRHILISHAAAPRVQGVTRSLEEAERLTAELFARIRGGESVASLVAEYSDDKNERYVLTAKEPPPGSGKFWRKQMMPSFSGFSWKLKVGEVGVAPYHPQKCLYGWHILERIR